MLLPYRGRRESLFLILLDRFGLHLLLRIPHASTLRSSAGPRSPIQSSHANIKGFGVAILSSLSKQMITRTQTGNRKRLFDPYAGRMGTTSGAKKKHEVGL